MRKRAFTLIELLVVIAIIAILAAILFPVFAQAKAAAKKTQGISNTKQLGTSFAIYMTDYDDKHPLASGMSSSSGAWGMSGWHDVPKDWDPTVPQWYVDRSSTFWANGIFPYVKNKDIFNDPNAKVSDWAGVTLTGREVTMSYTFNGLLHAYDGSAVNRPAELMMLSQSFGEFARRGSAFSNPFLLSCGTDASCRYQPQSATCAGSPGAWSWLIQLDFLAAPGAYKQWTHTNGIVATFADTHAKWRKLGGAVDQPTDYTRDPFTEYTDTDYGYYSWYDSDYCHALLYKPDFDFANYGTPVSGV
ncbi:MAG: prepilin-type N-terminal cleavage/methylation domain-containing protein [Fimbriimonadaceae bacterium]